MKDRRHTDGISGVLGTPTVVFQRVVDLNERTHSFEALGRRFFPEHPEIPELHPDEFLPGMRRFEDMHNFTLQVAALVCEKIRRTGNPHQVHLNTPITHLTDDMLWGLQGIQERFNVPSTQLGIEILEYPAFPKWPAEALRVAHEFKRMQHSIYMDDFKGYGKFEWQWEAAAAFPFDCIKIDVSLLRGLSINLISTMKRLEGMGFHSFIIEGASSILDLRAIEWAIAELQPTTTVHVQGFIFSEPSHDALAIN